MSPRLSRSITLAISCAGAIFNVAIAIRLLALWRSLRWESESEWEGSDVWIVDSVKLVWGLLSAYFAAAAAASAIGAVGIARNIPSFVRFFRDYSIADFAFSVITTVALSYTSFTTSYVRTGVCEGLSRQPELMRDIVQTGLNLENCEFWFERVFVVLLGIMFILIAIRLHFVMTLSRLYSQLRRESTPPAGGKPRVGHRSVKSDSMQRIYLLPTATSPPCSSYHDNVNIPCSHSRSNSLDNVIVYAPIPVGGFSEQDALEMNATEAWISSPSAPMRSHRHSHSQPHRNHGSQRSALPGHAHHHPQRSEYQLSSSDEKC